MNPMIEKLTKIFVEQQRFADIWLPEKIDPRSPEGVQKLGELSRIPGIFVHNEIENQLGEWIKWRNPKTKYTADSLKKAISKEFGEFTTWNYGTWFYYPWSNKLVHFLDEQKFLETRTSRNIYKITPEERDIIATKKIGVAGLSVGQSVSLVLAMERCFCELRIADFDILELSNLNRIRTGVHNLGINKGVAVAREIFEIDPYLKIKVFSGGLTEDNLDRFFNEGGKLDLMVDEIDGLDIKILLRYKARELGVPVVMDMSDKGTLDVERFDLEPERPILHGWIDHLDHTKIKGLSNEEKIPYLLPILHTPTLTKRIKASMIEVGQTITTWPQLASSVALGGALAADTIRRIFLNQFKSSGRYQVDLEAIVSDEIKSTSEFGGIDYHYPLLTNENLLVWANEAMEKLGLKPAAITENEIRKMVEGAIKAPSAGNNQPWKWLYYKGHAFLFHEKAHSVGWTDYDNTLAYISLGTAIETFALQAQENGFSANVEYWPVTDNELLIAVISCEASNAIVKSDLAKYIGLRCTNRKKGNRKDVPEELLSFLKAIAANPDGISLEFLTEYGKLDKVADMVAKAERMRLLHPQGHYEFFGKEMRWTKEEVLAGDGMDINTLELNIQDRTGMEVASDPEVVELLAKWKGGQAFEKLSREAVSSSSALGLVTIPDYSHIYKLKGGRVVQRLWLGVTCKEWSLQPVSAPLFFFNRAQEPDNLLTEEMAKEAIEIGKELMTVFESLKHRKGLFLFRLSKADPPTAVALRRSLTQLYVGQV